MNYERIKILIKSQGRTLKWLCQQIGMTEPGFAKMMREESMKVETLMKIAKVLNTPLNYFFDDTNLSNDFDASLPLNSAGDKEELVKKYTDLLEKYNRCLEELLLRKREMN